MHPLDRFFGGGEVEDTVGLLEIFLGVLCWLLWLPIAFILDEWYSVSAPLVALSNENGFALACYENIFFFVDRNSFLGENGYVVIVSYFPTLMSEVGKSLNVSAFAAFVESCRKGSAVTYCPLHVLPFNTPTFLADILSIGRPTVFLSFSLM